MTTTSTDTCLRIFEQWHEYARTRQTDALVALYADDAILETPLIPAILVGVDRGMLRGHAELRQFFEEGGRRRPDDRVRWWRDGSYLCNGATLFWEYPRQMPDGEQVDIAEVMTIVGGKIAAHRIYWGWFGFAMLRDSRSAKEA